MEISGSVVLRVVTPYRPFAPESPAHRKLGEFDWVAAIAMLRESVRQTNNIETAAITDIDCDLPGAALQYATQQRRLMLWILEVALRYIESEDFDQDTVMVSPDILVFGSIERWFDDYDIGVLIRRTNDDALHPVLNAVQFWRVASKDKLIPFYRKVLDIACRLPEKDIIWGGDTLPFVYLLAPFEFGIQERRGLKVGMIKASRVLHSATPNTCDAPDRMIDFRNKRKHFMKAYYDRFF